MAVAGAMLKHLPRTVATAATVSRRLSIGRRSRDKRAIVDDGRC